MTVHPILANRVIDILEQHDGDIDASLNFIWAKTGPHEKTSIKDAMTILDETRANARYEHTNFPALPDILRKKSKSSSDEIWEGRPKWTNRNVKPGALVQRLDTNAAYLSALLTHLPIGKLEHAAGSEFDRKRSGVYLITPPEWTDTDLPNPLGNREEPGKLWVTRPTVQLMFDAARWELCEPPTIHEHWTSGSSENMLKPLRQILAEARTAAIDHDDVVLLEYVKKMYSKLVSTMGESTNNPDMRRPDWAHIIRAQAFSNLWRKAKKAYDQGLTVYHMAGTDELHLIGEWRAIWKEGRALGELKVKSVEGDNGIYPVPEPRGKR